ncbi:MAG: ATP-binding cassette domain-containing protein [Flavobacterium sp.]|nr:ATP-binding cassette domain-containing protein [Pedobacter sp.]
MSIVVSNISKTYGRQNAVDQISFTAQPGCILGFLGPNGAGKSTTMKILTCFIPPSSGKASICGYDVVTQSLEVRKNIGYLPEHNPLYTDMYVKEALGFMADVYQIPNKSKRIAEVIELAGLGLEQRKKISTLSKGYRQRVGLAQAIIHNPPVLILDEPTSGLDPNQIIGIRNLIKELGKTKTVILSTHIMQEVEAICHQIVIINQGKLVADDSIEGLKNSHPAKTLEEIFIYLTNAVLQND